MLADKAHQPFSKSLDPPLYSPYTQVKLSENIINHLSVAFSSKNATQTTKKTTHTHTHTKMHTRTTDKTAEIRNIKL